jgi:hypothetical protein
MKIRIVAATGLMLSMLAFSAQARVCSVGDPAQVLWKGKWYPASVTKVNEDQSRCFVRYTGYGSNWDEWVGADRIRVQAAAPVAASAYRVGDAVQVKWKGKWYDASILKVDGARYRIHYDQYDSSWDEWVGPERVRAR